MGWSLSLVLLLLIAGALAFPQEMPVDYTGHKVISVVPETESHLATIEKLKELYKLDVWNEPRSPGTPVMIHLPPDVFDAVTKTLREEGMFPTVSIKDLQETIDEEKVANAPDERESRALENFNYGKYRPYEEILNFLSQLEASYPSLVRSQTVGQSYEGRAIKALRITSGLSGSKPVIFIDAGIHPREWTSTSTALFILGQLVTKYSSDQEVKNLLDKYEFLIIPQANPDGYIWTWTRNRMWRKTRSKSRNAFSPWCVGADANRNFDIQHCGVGTSRDPCEDIYCGDYPFSESETRTIRDVMTKYQSRMKMYITLHAFSQYWMVPYAYTKALPPNYNELMRIAQAGVTRLRGKYGTTFKYGTIANIIYEAAGSSVDYAHSVLDINLSFALELRDTGLNGFFLPQHQILPAAEEAWEGIKAAIAAA